MLFPAVYLTLTLLTFGAVFGHALAHVPSHYLAAALHLVWSEH